MKLKLDDFLNYRFLSNVCWAPGGRHAAFAVSKCNEEENDYESSLWLYEDGAGVRRLTSGGHETSFIWEDDEHLLFPAVRSEADKKRAKNGEIFTVWYRIDIRGGEAQRAFELPLKAAAVKKAGEDIYAVLASTDVLYPDYYKMDKAEKAKVHAFYEEEKDYHVLDEAVYWQNGAGFTNKQRTSLFIYDLKKNSLKKLTGKYMEVSDVCIKGGCIYYAGENFETKPSMKADIYAYDIETEKTECFYDKKIYDVGGLAEWNGQIAVLASDGKRFGINEHPWVYCLDEKNRDLTVFYKTEDSFWPTVGSDCRYGAARSIKAAGDKFYFISTRGFCSALYSIDKEAKEQREAGCCGSVDDFDVSGDGLKILFAAMADGKLQELYKAGENGKIEQVTHFNDAVLKDKYTADYERITVFSEGENIDGWILRPADFDINKTYPAILDIHGGPETVYGEVFYHEMQYWANEGYFVFFCNPRGSDGRGNTFADIRGKYGTVDYKNIMDFTDAVLEKYPQIDKSKVAVTGGSYGGFMTNWIVGHTDRFACAASQRSISNWISFYGISDIGTYFGTDQTAGDIYANHDKMWEASPLKYADKVKTPVLFIHSDEDFRCPISEGLQFYTALADRGVPVRLCWFKGENHELSRSGKPKHRIKRLKEITEWIKKYTK